MSISLGQKVLRRELYSEVYSEAKVIAIWPEEGRARIDSGEICSLDSLLPADPPLRLPSAA